jgi:FkbM family methyltransferase
LVKKRAERDGVTVSREERPYASISFSQFGEDLAVLRHFERRIGFYVDVGAHHPIRFSNTHLLYRRGWSGINIDANPEAIRLFGQMRPRDLNIHAALSDKVQQVEFSLYEESALSRIEVTSGAAARGNATLPTPLQKIVLQTVTLEKLLARELPRGRTIDFLNVDCEGHDLAVLSSNDWARFRPEVVAVEDWETTTPTEVDRFLAKQGYTMSFLELPAKLFIRATETLPQEGL